jgi:CAAX protease family protein
MTPEPPKPEYPFWSYLDLLMFVVAALPCWFVGSLLAGLFSSMLPAFKSAALWIGMLAIYILWFGCLFLILRTKYDRPFWESLGWIVPDRGKAIVFFGGPALAISVGLLGIVLRTPPNEMPLFRKLLHDPLSIVLFGIFSTVLGPITEELAFRGFIMPLFIRSFGPAAGIVLTALPFALLHGPQYGWTWQYVVLVCVAGIAFGWVRYRTGSTVASAIMHGTYNLTFFAFLIFHIATL